MGRLLRVMFRLGVLAIVGYLVKRWFDGQRPTADAGGWAAIEPPATVAAVPGPRTPVVPMVQPDVVEVGNVEQPGEPALEPDAPTEGPTAGPAPAAVPARKAPAKKKAAAKKAPAKKKAPGKKAPAKSAPATKAPAPRELTDRPMQPPEDTAP